jgi:hypothetical protein
VHILLLHINEKEHYRINELAFTQLFLAWTLYLNEHMRNTHYSHHTHHYAYTRPTNYTHTVGP